MSILCRKARLVLKTKTLHKVKLAELVHDIPDETGKATTTENAVERLLTKTLIQFRTCPHSFIN